MPAAKRIEATDLVEAGPGIYYSRHPLPLIGGDIVALLKQAAAANPRKRARFCAHPAPDAPQHDMLIASHRETYVTPHRHPGHSESFTILEGAADLLLFDERGGLSEIVAMGPTGFRLPFFYRMPPGVFHALSIDSEVLVFVESTLGPFQPGNSENAPWAPPPDDTAAGRAFIASLLKR